LARREAVLLLRAVPTAALRSTSGRKNVSRELFTDCRRANLSLTLSIGTPENIMKYAKM